MPELPDLTVYQNALGRRLIGATWLGLRLGTPFLLRTVTPAAAELVGRKVTAIERVGKRLVIALEDDYFAVLHLMIAGRLRWDDAPGAKLPGRIGLAGIDFSTGTLLITEAGSKRRASLHLLQGHAAPERFRGGIEPLTATLAAFTAALTKENHTVKRALTDPWIIAGIGNAYSDEILHAAQLSPLVHTQKLSPEAWANLHRAMKRVLATWIERLSGEAGDAFPGKVTAFHPQMAVHGKYRQPCPVCASPVQRIRYAENEANYCAKCQTGGRLLADRSLSRLLHGDWPKTLAELEERRETASPKVASPKVASPPERAERHEDGGSKA